MTLLADEYLESVDDARCDQDVVDVWRFKGDEVKLFDEPNWTLNVLQSSVSDAESLSVYSAFDDVKTACGASGI